MGHWFNVTDHMRGNPDIYSSFQADGALSLVTVADGSICDWKLEYIPRLPVMWSVAPESIIHWFEKDIRHAFSSWTRVVIEINSFCNNWYYENFANFSNETKILL